MRYVIDASVAVRWFLAGESDERSDAVLERLPRQPELFAVPELFLFEVYAVLCRVHPKPVTAYCDGFLPLVQSGILRYPMTEAIARGADVFVSRGLTGHDAVYAALARELGALWLTYDALAHRSIRDDGISRDLGEGFPADWNQPVEPGRAGGL